MFIVAITFSTFPSSHQIFKKGYFSNPVRPPSCITDRLDMTISQQPQQLIPSGI